MCSCPAFDVTHAHHMCLDSVWSHFSVIVHCSNLVINTTNKSTSTCKCSLFVVLPMKRCRTTSSWCAEEATNVLSTKMKQYWLSPHWYCLTLMSRSLHSSICMWLRLNTVTQTLYHMWTIWYMLIANAVYTRWAKTFKVCILSHHKHYTAINMRSYTFIQDYSKLSTCIKKS